MAEDLYTMGIRKALNERNISNERIGFDVPTQYVTIDGQKAIKAYKNQNDTAYTSPTQFGADYGAYDAASKQKTAETNFLNPEPYVNPIDQRVQDVLAQITQRTTNPVSVDPYGTPQFTAAQAQVQQGADQGIRSAQESLGGSGLARSSIVTDRAQRIQNDANQYLQTQLVPQIQQQLQAEEERKTQGLMSLLTALSGQQGLYDTRNENSLNRSGDILDYFTNRSDKAQEYATNLDETNYQRGQDSIENSRYTDEFAYKKEQDKLAQTNLQEEKKFRAERASVGDQQWFQEYNRAGEQFAASQGLQWANLNQRQQEFVADQAQRQLDREAANDPNSLDNRYKQAQIDNLNGKTEQPTPIDEYDLLQVETLAKQAGINPAKAKPEEIKMFVAGLKTQQGWSTEEAKAVESYLTNKKPVSTPSSGTGSGNFLFSTESPSERLKDTGDLIKSIPGTLKDNYNYWIDFFKSQKIMP